MQGRGSKLLQQFAGTLKGRIRLAGKTDNDIRGNKGISFETAEKIEGLPYPGGIVAPGHTSEDSIVTGLDGNVKMGTYPGIRKYVRVFRDKVIRFQG